MAERLRPDRTEHSGDDLQALEQSLLTSFRTAARSVTQLYKDAQCIQRHAYRQGYEQCLQELLDFLASHPQVQQRDSNAGAASIPADDLVSYARARHAQLMAEAEESEPHPTPASTPASTSIPFGSNSPHPFQFTPTHSQLSMLATAQQQQQQQQPAPYHVSTAHNNNNHPSAHYHGPTGVSRKRRRHHHDLGLPNRDLDMFGLDDDEL